MQKIYIIRYILMAFITILFSCEAEDPLFILLGEKTIAIDLGEEFIDPGFEIDNGKADDVVITFSPEYNKHKIDEYIINYAIGNVSTSRTLWVKSDLLSGIYNVQDQVDEGESKQYETIVEQKDNTYNSIRLINFGGFEDNLKIVVVAIINGEHVVINRQSPANWHPQEFVEGTGTYNGETKELISITYTIQRFVEEELQIFTGTIEFDKID
jgi:hypothetical protein